jgi:hypothetical protein
MSAIREILGELEKVLGRYVAFQSVAQRLAVALWIAHTYVFERFEVTPYLAITSAEKQSGKTRLLTLLNLLAARPWSVVLPSEAVVFRTIEDRAPTLLLDEVDAIYGPKARDHEGLRALLNAGFQRGATVPRCVGTKMEVKDFAVFCPKALAGIGNLPDTVADRAIPIRMRRRAPSEPIVRLRRRHIVEESQNLRQRLEQWSESVEFGEAEPLLPDPLSDRAQDAWEPLLTIAEVSGGEELACRARLAAIELHASQDDLEASLGVRLLSDISIVFGFHQNDRLFTEELLVRLCGIEEAPWGAWNGGKGLAPHGLARLLRPYEIQPKTVRQAAVTAKGYFRSDFADAWSRYVLPPSTGPSQHEDPPPSVGSREPVASDGRRILALFEQRGTRIWLHTDGEGVLTEPPLLKLPRDLFQLLVDRKSEVRAALRERA